MRLQLQGSEFTLLQEKALYKHDESLLIIADVHLGKASHFRKAGISIPAHAQMDDYVQLEKLFLKIKPQKVYFLGDLFHSTFNRDWHFFADLINRFTAISFTLIKGNHDLINKTLFHDLGIVVVDDHIEDGPFIYSHKPMEVPVHQLNIAGHIHPGIRLSGLALQSFTIPCFHHSGNVFLLPAFGLLTGLYIMNMDKADNIFAVLPSEIRKL